MDGGPVFYRNVDDFMRESSIPLDEMLRQIYGAISRQALIETLHEVERALDDASTVVDAGEDEEYAYQHELERLRKLIERLEQGAFIAEHGTVEMARALVSGDDRENCECERERTCCICGSTFKYADTHSRDLGPDGVDLCSNACAMKYWERHSDDEDDADEDEDNGAIHCPTCGSENIFVVQVSCMQHAKPHIGRWPLTLDGFAWDESGSHRDGSTTDEFAECDHCGERGSLDHFGFGE